MCVPTNTAKEPPEVPRHHTWFDRICCRLGWHTFTVVSSRVTLEFGPGEGGKKVVRHYYSRWCPVCDVHWHREEGGDGVWAEGPYWTAFEEVERAAARVFEAADAAQAAVQGLANALRDMHQNPK